MIFNYLSINVYDILMNKRINVTRESVVGSSKSKLELDDTTRPRVVNDKNRMMSMTGVLIVLLFD